MAVRYAARATTPRRGCIAAGVFLRSPAAATGELATAGPPGRQAAGARGTRQGPARNAYPLPVEEPHLPPCRGPVCPCLHELPRVSCSRLDRAKATRALAPWAARHSHCGCLRDEPRCVLPACTCPEPVITAASKCCVGAPRLAWVGARRSKPQAQLVVAPRADRSRDLRLVSHPGRHRWPLVSRWRGRSKPAGSQLKGRERRSVAIQARTGRSAPPGEPMVAHTGGGQESAGWREAPATSPIADRIEGPKRCGCDALAPSPCRLNHLFEPLALAGRVP